MASFWLERELVNSIDCTLPEYVADLLEVDVALASAELDAPDGVAGEPTPPPKDDGCRDSRLCALHWD